MTRAEAEAARAEMTAIADWLRPIADPADVALLDAIMEIRRDKTVLRGSGGTYRELPGKDRRPYLVRLLAVRYSGRPGYQPGWAPEPRTTPEA